MDKHLAEAMALASRVDQLMADALQKSAPMPNPPPNATEVGRASGTRRVVPGPNPCRRWGGR